MRISEQFHSTINFNPHFSLLLPKIPQEPQDRSLLHHSFRTTAVQEPQGLRQRFLRGLYALGRDFFDRANPELLDNLSAVKMQLWIDQSNENVLLHLFEHLQPFICLTFL